MKKAKKRRKPDMLQAALAYYDEGVLCVPYDLATRKPYVEFAALRDAGKISRECIENWFKKFPYADIAMITGERSGRVVLDVDKPDVLKKFEKKYGKLPHTYKVWTRTEKHFQLHFKWCKVKNGHLTNYFGLEVKSNTLVTIPPSKEYENANHFPLAEMPESLVKEAAIKKSKTTGLRGGKIPDGRGNDTLTELGGYLRGQYGFPESVIRKILMVANRAGCEKPLEPGEIIAIAHSMASYIPEEAKTVKHTRLIYQKLSEIKEKKIEFLWEGRVFKGKPTVLAGPGDSGKSTLMAFMIATYTGRRIRWPDGAPCGTGSAIVLSAEDDAADTLKPRIKTMSGDSDKVFVIQGVREGRGHYKWFDIRKHVGELERLFKRYSSIGFLGIDPCTAYLGGQDANKNEAVREAMGPITQIIAKYNSACVLVTHFNKDITKQSIDRVISSVAWVNLARAVNYVIVDPEDEAEERRLFLPGKMNIGKKPLGLAFEIIQAKEGLTQVRLRFEKDPVLLKADDIIVSDRGRPIKKRKWAEEFLTTVLSEGPMRVSDLKKGVENESFSWSTVEAASQRLKIKKKEKFDTEGHKGYWIWTLATPK